MILWFVGLFSLFLGANCSLEKLLEGILDIFPKED
jgi:hypothetical protein